MTTTKPEWNDLSHADKLAVLRDNSIEGILKDYHAAGLDESMFRALLTRELALWKPNQCAGPATSTGKPPNKEVVLGAWRDLDRAEALLELIDNSIDAWNRRRAQYPQKAAPELNIYIEIDSDTGQLTYEDNAGGVPEGKLVNLVIPGHSETGALDQSIGSYKTGGKKAIFRLATAANITTAFWNPAETGDTAVAVHLDEHWLKDVDQYQFPYYPLKDAGGLQRGQTRYLMQLRPEPLGAHWYSNPQEVAKIGKEIKNTYGLYMVRNKDINIYFPKRNIRVEPHLTELYDLSGAAAGQVDIQPQCVEFQTLLDYEGKKYDLTIEIMIGCRTTAAEGENVGPGFDLYGNNRLFKFRDDRLFHEFLPKGMVASYIRGWVNIIGPNIFLPWDTHKRHLNEDRDVIELIRTHPAIRNLFENWSEAFKQIQGLGRGEVTKTVNVPFSLVDTKTKALSIPHQHIVKIDPLRKRGQKLPPEIFKPKVVSSSKAKRDAGVAVNMVFTTDEARQLAAYFGVHGAMDSAQTKRLLSDSAKEHLLGLIRLKKAKRA